MFEQDIRLGPGTGTYTQHTWEILIMLLGAFLLGIWLGWILWNRYKQEVEKLRLDNQSLKITSDTLTTELSTLKAKYTAIETDNTNLSAQIVSLNRNNSNLRERITQMESEVEETQSRNRQVETELGLSYNPDTPVADDIPLEVVAQDNPDTPEAPTEPDIVAPVVATVPPENNVSVVISEGSTPLAEVIIHHVAREDGEEKPPVHAEVHVSAPVETLNPPAATAIVPTSEPENVVVGAAAGAQDDLTVVEGIGPKIQMLLNQYGVHTYRQLADTPVERLREILTNAGPQLAMHDPGTWPSQANLAANDQWDALKSIQGFLKGGKKPT
jgi:predicted flap endonuclease-1-like 5' DNA nuclease/cell division protein FtsB